MSGSRSTQIIPVLDIIDGLVVKACGGWRGDYIPIVSPIISSPDPAHIIGRFMELFNFSLFYIADLDAIMGAGSNKLLINELLNRFDIRLMLDGGFRLEDDIWEHPNLTPIVATETFTDWDSAASLSHVIVSIDTVNGNLLTPDSEMTVESALNQARALGAKRFIHLRLDAVGESSFDVSRLVSPVQGEEWYAGGGVQTYDDLRLLDRLGYVGALVSTAIHNQKLP